MTGSAWSAEETALLLELGGSRLEDVAERTGRTLKAVEERWRWRRLWVVPAVAGTTTPAPPVAAAAAAAAADTLRLPGLEQKAGRSSAHAPAYQVAGHMVRQPGMPIPPPRDCQWPEGDPGEPGFRLCGSSDLVAGRPYCAQHCRRAFAKPASRDAGTPA